MQMCRYCRRIGDDSTKVRLPRSRSLALGECVANSYLAFLSAMDVHICKSALYIYISVWVVEFRHVPTGLTE